MYILYIDVYFSTTAYIELQDIFVLQNKNNSYYLKLKVFKDWNDGKKLLSQLIVEAQL